MSSTAFVDARAAGRARSACSVIIAQGRHVGGEREMRAQQRRSEMCGAMQWEVEQLRKLSARSKSVEVGRTCLGRWA
jgi:hypothetical protein